MLDAINQQFAIQDNLSFDLHEDGLVRGLIHHPTCSGEFFLHGGHVTQFQPAGQEPILFLSSAAKFLSGKAIRGGVPICFPWFGAHPRDAAQPSHGLARTQGWQLLHTSATAEGVVVELGFSVHAFELRYRMQYASSLKLELSIHNRSEQVTQCEVALHTYLNLGDVRQVRIHGLESQDYLDQLTRETVDATHEPISFCEETDRIYWGTADQIHIVDPQLKRMLLLKPFGSHATVVWNPWIAKSERMDDLGNEEYLRMCCVETANIRPKQVELDVNQSQSVGVEISAAAV